MSGVLLHATDSLTLSHEQQRINAGLSTWTGLRGDPRAQLDGIAERLLNRRSAGKDGQHRFLSQGLS